MSISNDCSRPALPAVTESGDWSVYLVLCGNGSLYCGISKKPRQRFADHAAGKGAKYMRIHQPVAMKLVRSGISYSQALRMEIQIKRLTSARKRELWVCLDDFQTA